MSLVRFKNPIKRGNRTKHSSVLVGEDLNFALANEVHHVKTLTANTVFTFSNPVVGNDMYLRIDGGFTVTWPPEFLVVLGAYDPLAAVNTVFIHCFSPTKFLVRIFSKIANIIDGLGTDIIDFSYLFAIYYRTLTEKTNFGIVGTVPGNRTTLHLDSLEYQEQKTFSLPAGISVLSGSLDFSSGRINKIDLVATSPTTYDANIINNAANTNIYKILELEEAGGNFQKGAGNNQTDDFISESFPAGIEYQPNRTARPFTDRYKIGNTNQAVLTPPALFRDREIVSELTFRIILDTKTATDGRSILELTENGGAGDFIAIQSLVGNKYRFIYSLGAGPSHIIDGGVQTGLSELFGTIDSSGNMRFFQNGSQIGATLTGISAINLAHTWKMAFAGRADASLATIDADILHYSMIGVALTPAEVASANNGGNYQDLESVLDASRGAGTFEALDFTFIPDFNSGPQEKVIGEDGSVEVGSPAFSSEYYYVDPNTVVPLLTAPSIVANPTVRKNVGVNSLQRLLYDIVFPQEFSIATLVRIEASKDGRQRILWSVNLDGGANDRFSIFESSGFPFNIGILFVSGTGAAVLDFILNPFVVGGWYTILLTRQAVGTYSLYINGALVKLGAGTVVEPTAKTLSLQCQFINGANDRGYGTQGPFEIVGTSLTPAEALDYDNGGSPKFLQDVLDSSRGAGTYAALPFKWLWRMNNHAFAVSKTLDHLPAANTGLVEAKVNRIPKPASSPKIGGLVSYDFLGVAGGATNSIRVENNILSGDWTFFFILQYHVLTSGYFLFARPFPYVDFFNSFAMFANASGNIIFSHTDGLNVSRAITTTGAYGINTDLFLGFGIDSAGDSKIYVNGVEDASGNIAPLNSVIREFVIGKNPSGGVSPFNGLLHHHWSHNGILTPKQHELIFNHNRGNSLGVVLDI